MDCLLINYSALSFSFVSPRLFVVLLGVFRYIVSLYYFRYIDILRLMQSFSPMNGEIDSKAAIFIILLIKLKKTIILVI